MGNIERINAHYGAFSYDFNSRAISCITTVHLPTFHPGRYILRHWQGLLPLWVSVLVNLVALRILASLLQPLLSPPKATIAVLFAYVLFAHVMVLVWQVVGVLRAAERYAIHSGFHTPALGAQIIAITAIILTMPQYMAAYHATLPPPAAADYLERMDRKHAAQYVLQVSPDGRSLSFSGLIALGATRRVRAILLKNKAIRKLLITSKGGNSRRFSWLDLLVECSREPSNDQHQYPKPQHDAED